ncbi:CAF1-domain-containing protein [Fomitiporia mediterranea MF3/22]|uniref:CAF1-domain-containing protein n=1 Tax=Fomitiporia mediterranea (strain MF3/22) TaxID=694068 RepID=UPI0004408529|nr:CAF1-domain-containing protein [Fomitiporia mediterranea MF3/22]EJC97855.1 CAF1-domain-containing protein [Fomitiporia mediterranea MF3/22]
MAARIREVWASNLDAEMRAIRDTVERYPYVAMDTEFPGVVARPIGTFRTSSDYHYQTMRCNVDLLKIIQIGLTLSDAEGNLPDDVCTWQFNFQFDLQEDMFSPDSIELLRESGLNFQRHLTEGIQPNDFAELLITSGLVLTDETKWISFHSGYDFGYLVKLLSCVQLPPMEEDFFDLFSLWFPTVYDVKYMMRTCKLRGGLQDVAKMLDVVRIGPIHQAGSDSLLTASVFFKMRQLYHDDLLDDSEYKGKLYGLGKTAVQLTNGTYDTVSAHGLVQYGRSAVTSAERERTPPREQAGLTVQGQTQQGGSQQQGMNLGAPGMLGGGPASLPTPGGPGLGGFSNTIGSPYGTIPVGVNGAYHLRQIGVGGDR